MIGLALCLALAQEVGGPARQVLPLATTEQFLSLPDPPVVNRLGQVLFHAIGRDGRAGIHVTIGGAPQPVVRVGDLIRTQEGPLVVQGVGRGPCLNDRGQVAFSARLGLIEAVLVRDGPGGRFEFVADSSEAFREFGPVVQMNESGEVLFFATVDRVGHPDRTDGPAQWSVEEEEPPPPPRLTRSGWKSAYHAGLFLDTADGLEVVARTTGQFLDLGQDFSLSGLEFLAYRAWQQGTGEALVRVTAFAPPETLAQQGPFSQLHEFSVNVRGTAVFRAMDPTGRHCLGLSRRGQVGARLLTVPGLETSTLAPGVCLGDDDTVLCVVRGTEGDRLLRRTSEGHWGELLRAGRELWPGARVEQIQVSGRSLTAAGRVVARVTLASPGGEALVLLIP